MTIYAGISNSADVGCNLQVYIPFVLGAAVSNIVQSRLPVLPYNFKSIYVQLLAKEANKPKALFVRNPTACFDQGSIQ